MDSPSTSLAYTILAHKLPEQVVRLVERLDSPNATFFVHVDRKAGDEPYRRIVAALRERPNLHLVPRVAHFWGGYGHVEASLIAIREALGREVPFDHFILLTGQDYPIKPRAAIEAHFAAHPDRSFLEYFALPREGWPGHAGLHRVTRRYFRVTGSRYVGVPNKVVPFLRPTRLPSGYRPYQGSAYWALSRPMVGYVAEFVEANPWFCRFMRRSLSSSELFFHTLILNSPRASEVTNLDLHYKDWPGHGPHPELLESRHLPELARADNLFARKFDSERDSEVLDLIDREILDI